jgi:succinate dehydrogenase/fumarate reductase flavoprotein subunit
MAGADRWDLECDVVIAGYGYAGAIAAMAAHDAGREVAIFEKMPHFGGNSILSGGSVVVARAYEPALAYLRRTTMGTTDDELLQTFARGMVELPTTLRRLAAEVGFEMVETREGPTYPFEGGEALYTVHVTRNEKYQGFSWAKGLKAGGTLFWVVSENVAKRDIDVRYEAPVRELVRGEDGEVRGVVAELGGKRVRVAARRGVVLATGGFEHNERLRQHFLQIQGTISMSPLGNTGDGIMMAQKAGAALWHMWHVHGGYGFRVPDLPVAVRHTFSGFRDSERPMPWIAVDRFGRRFMDEYPPAPQDTGMRPLEYYDPDIQDYPRIPAYLVFDEQGRKLGPIGQVKSNDERITFEWSEDNLAEVAAGYVKRAETLKDLARLLGIEPENLTESVERWNRFCREGADRDFRRPRGTMMPLETPPFYCSEAWPIITNTQGGPIHNTRQQIVDPYGTPISRLYSAGEMGSMFGHLYLLAGNNAECFIGGQIAGWNAAVEEPWTD